MCHCFLFTLVLGLGVKGTANTPTPKQVHYSRSFFFNKHTTDLCIITLIREPQPGLNIINAYAVDTKTWHFKDLSPLCSCGGDNKAMMTVMIL